LNAPPISSSAVRAARPLIWMLARSVGLAESMRPMLPLSSLRSAL